MTLPDFAPTVVIGAGVHGISVAYHLSELLREDGRSGRHVVVLDKGRVGAGASGISAGIVRNFYLFPLALDLACELDPYGRSHDDAPTDPQFDEAIVSALAWTLGRFADPEERWTRSSFAAPTCFTSDSYPIVGHVRENVYVLLDSNHGFEMLALGKLAAREVLGGVSVELEPFHVDRFAQAAPHPTSASPYPWT